MDDFRFPDIPAAPQERHDDVENVCMTCGYPICGLRGMCHACQQRDTPAEWWDEDDL